MFTIRSTETFAAQNAPVKIQIDDEKPQVQNIQTQIQTKPTHETNVSVFESKTELIVIAQIPGASFADTDVSLHEDILTIDAKTDIPDSKNLDTLADECHWGEWHRTLRLPTGMIDHTGISAKMANGVLMLNLPKISHGSHSIKIVGT